MSTNNEDLKEEDSPVEDYSSYAQESTAKSSQAWRDKQIELGKLSSGYLNYIKLVPLKKDRKRHDPHTPNSSRNISKRRFMGLYKEWRTKLHKFDDIDDEKFHLDNIRKEIVQEFKARKNQSQQNRQKSENKTVEIKEETDNQDEVKQSTPLSLEEKNSYLISKPDVPSKPRFVLVPLTCVEPDHPIGIVYPAHNINEENIQNDSPNPLTWRKKQKITALTSDGKSSEHRKAHEIERISWSAPKLKYIRKDLFGNTQSETSNQNSTISTTNSSLESPSTFDTSAFSSPSKVDSGVNFSSPLQTISEFQNESNNPKITDQDNFIKNLNFETV